MPRRYGRAVATEGFGARVLERQDPDGRWAGGAYFPAGFDMEAGGEGQPWTATTWSLTSLREWGLDPAVLRERRTVDLLAENCRWEYDDLPYWGGEVDCCINAWTLANGRWLGADVEDFRSAAPHDGGPPDPCMSDAIGLIRAARQPDGADGR